MPVTWSPRGGTPEDIEHWNKIRSSPDFGTGYLNIKDQILAHKKIPILQKRIKELEELVSSLKTQMDKENTNLT